MKGALAVLTTLFTELHQRHPGLSLGLAVTADEESGGHGAHHLVTQGLACGVALLPDGGSIDRVVAAEKGILHLDAEWRGVSTHAAYPWEGRNPVDAMLDDLARLRTRFAALANGASAEHWHPTATVHGPRWSRRAVPSMDPRLCARRRQPYPQPDPRLPVARAASTSTARFTPPWTGAGILAEIRAGHSRGMVADRDLQVSSGASPMPCLPLLAESSSTSHIQIQFCGNAPLVIGSETARQISGLTEILST